MVELTKQAVLECRDRAGATIDALLAEPGPLSLADVLGVTILMVAEQGLPHPTPRGKPLESRHLHARRDVAVAVTVFARMHQFAEAGWVSSEAPLSELIQQAVHAYCGWCDEELRPVLERGIEAGWHKRYLERDQTLGRGRQETLFILWCSVQRAGADPDRARRSVREFVKGIGEVWPAEELLPQQREALSETFLWLGRTCGYDVGVFYRGDGGERIKPRRVRDILCRELRVPRERDAVRRAQLHPEVPIEVDMFEGGDPSPGREVEQRDMASEVRSAVDAVRTARLARAKRGTASECVLQNLPELLSEALSLRALAARSGFAHSSLSPALKLEKDALARELTRRGFCVDDVA